MPWDIPLDREQTSRLIEGTGAEISAVNYANRVLVSGRTADIEKARIRFEENGIPVNAMNVETAGHCCLVDGILDGIENAVRKVHFEKMEIPILSSFKADLIDDETVSDPLFWRQHTRGTVNFYEASQKLMDEENLVFIEIGTGMQLSTFIRKIFIEKRETKVIPLVPYSDSSEYIQFLQAIGEIWAAGVKPDWSVLGFGNETTYVTTYHFTGREFTHKASAVKCAKNGNVLIYDGLKDSSFEKSEYIVRESSGRVMFAENSREKYTDQKGAGFVFGNWEDIKKKCCGSFFDNSNVRLLRRFGSYEDDANRLAAACIMEYFRKSERFDIHAVYTIDKLMDTVGAEQAHKPYIDYFLCPLSDCGYINMEYGMFSFLPAAETLQGMHEVLDECRGKYPDCCAYMELCVHIPFFKKMKIKVKEITGDEINEYYAYLRGRGMKGTSCQRHHSLLHLAFKSAMKRRIIPTNPVDQADRPKSVQFIGNYYTLRK